MKKNSKDSIDVIVVGGGHAGYEAALIAARMHADTLLISMNEHEIGRLSCNPSIGGIAKSHIVCEIDALGGEMARNADYTGIQFKTLNTRKGPAVQANRIQCDKSMYPVRLEYILRREKHLKLLSGIVRGVNIQGGKITGVVMQDGRIILAKAVVITTGTFLNGVIFIGKKQIKGGRWNDPSADELGHQLREIGLHLERLKTGTPPRLQKDSIDYQRMTLQPGETPPPFLSRQAREEWSLFHVEQTGKEKGIPNLFHVEQQSTPLHPWLPGTDQIPCFLTHTNERTHDIISKNLKKSALYGGDITGTGVRYCPSIEDKIVKFTSKNEHHVFIEPEGRNSDRIYPNGTSNSLPEDVQLEMIHSIEGLENAVMIRPGYGIEYDFVLPTQLKATLESKSWEHLYFAGQINGTTGYEEAGGQGLLAGVNAVLKLRGEEPLILSRSESYIGVLIDDLVTKGTNEPYRMFTSRAEYRLLLRQSNADYRMLPHAKRLGVVEDTVLQKITEEAGFIEKEVERLNRVRVDGKSVTTCLSETNAGYKDLPGAEQDLPDQQRLEIETRLKYDGYIARELDQIARAAKWEHQRIPELINYDEIKALRFEAREKLKQIRPQTIGQAGRISGVNPPDVSILSIWIRKISSSDCSCCAEKDRQNEKNQTAD